MRKHIRRPSPALVISLLALFVALGGVSYAAVKINGKDIKNKTIAGKKLKNKTVTGGKVKGNSLTGAQINEGSLGKVPSATNADKAAAATTATSATTAGSVSGQQIAKINYRANTGAPATVVFSGGGLTIQAACAAGPAISLTATTTKQNSSIYTWVSGDVNPVPADPVQADTEGGGFDTTTNFNLLATSGGNVSYVNFEYEALDGSVASGTIQADEGGQVNSCVATGHVIHG